MNKRVIFKGNLIRETNYKKILQLIGKGEQLTKLDIAYTLNISIPTVTTNINQLKEEGIIEEGESNIYTGGRKPKVIRLIPNSRISIGVNITKSKLTIMFMNLNNEVILTKESEEAQETLEQYIASAKKLIEQGINELGIKSDNILGIGISIPGSINENKGIIEQTNMGTKEVELEKIFEMFDDNVYIENEANLSLLAEKHLGKYHNLKNLLYIGINEGLGGGIFVNDELFTGVSGRAGEFGHMRLIEKATGKGYRVEDQISTKGLIHLYKKRTGSNIKVFSQYEKLVREGDEVAVEILLNGLEVLLMTIYNLTMVLDIQKVIIGGKVARLINTQPQLLKQLMTKYKDIWEKLEVDIDFSDTKHTSTIGAALLPILDFYKISTDNE